jgi:hypothetical protein
MLKDNNQGDQIDICTCWPIVLFGQFFKRVCATFLNCKSYVLILTKIGWATFGAIFSQNNLVTLDIINEADILGVFYILRQGCQKVYFDTTYICKNPNLGRY